MENTSWKRYGFMTFDMLEKSNYLPASSYTQQSEDCMGL